MPDASASKTRSQPANGTAEARSRVQSPIRRALNVSLSGEANASDKRIPTDSAAAARPSAAALKPASSTAKPSKVRTFVLNKTAASRNIPRPAARPQSVGVIRPVSSRADARVPSRSSASSRPNAVAASASTARQPVRSSTSKGPTRKRRRGSAAFMKGSSAGHEGRIRRSAAQRPAAEL